MGVTIKFLGENYDFFEKATITLIHNSTASTFSITGNYDKSNPKHIQLFRPLSYNEIEIFDSRGVKLITGTCLTSNPSVESKKTSYTIKGYSKTGVLEDCKIPVSLYPLEFNKLSLLEIATKLCQPFGIKVVVVNDGGAASEVINEVTADENQSVSGFIVEIAKQRNLIVSHDANGNLLLTRSNADRKSTATYRESIPATKIALSVDGRKFHSEITAMKQASIDTDNAGESTITNPLIGQFRPSTFQQSTGTDNTSEDVAKNKRSSELRGISLSVNSDRWEWLNRFNNNRIETAKPNNIIDIISPENYLSNRTRFFVEKVTLVVDSKVERSVLNCVLPEVYTGETPKIRFD